MPMYFVYETNISYFMVFVFIWVFYFIINNADYVYQYTCYFVKFYLLVYNRAIIEGIF